jgi:alginate O-acetyltransferase complex protein AlgI
LKRLFILALITFAWIFFRAQNMAQAFEIIASSIRHIPAQLRAIASNTDLARLKLLYVNKESSILFLSVMFCTLVFIVESRQKGRSITDYFATLSKPLRYATYLFLIYGSIIFGIFEKNQFIYFQF